MLSTTQFIERSRNVREAEMDGEGRSPNIACKSLLFEVNWVFRCL